MNLYETLEAFGENTVDNAVNNLKNKTYKHFNGQSYTKNNTGKLAKSTRYQITQDSGDLIVEFFYEDYGYIVDQGRQRGSHVPIQPLKDWCAQRGLNTGLAYVIERRIKLRGIAPTFFFTESFEFNYDQLNEDMLITDPTNINDNIEDILDQLDKELELFKK